MRLRSEVIGALNLFRTHPGELNGPALRTAQALVAVATIGLLQERSIHHQEVLTAQLQTALNSRVIIEQAKGLVAERLDMDMQDAFATLRDYARAHNLKLSDLARAVIAGRTGMHPLLTTPPPRPPSPADSDPRAR